MTFLEHGIPPRPAPTLRRLAPALPYAAVLVGLYGLSNAWAAVFLYQAGTIASVIAMRDTEWWRRFRGWNPRWAVVFGSLGAAGGLLLHLLWPWLGLEDRLVFTLSQLGLSGNGWTLFLFYFALVNPWFEEILWRGYLAGSAPGPDAGDVFFAGYHALVLRYFLAWPWVLVATLMLLVAAWLWRRSAIRFGGLLLPLFSHVVGGLSIAWVLLQRT